MDERLVFFPALSRLDLVSASVAACLRGWQGSIPVSDIWVAEIDPAAAGGADFCTRYGFKDTEGANCVIVEGQRGSITTLAACVMPVNHRTSLNSTVRKLLGARRVSIPAAEVAINETGMEHGSITAVGLPPSWPILIDGIVARAPRVVMGSGLRHSKLSLPGAALIQLPGSRVVEGLAHPVIPP